MNDIPLLNALPEKWRGWAVLLFLASPYITRAFYAVSNGGGIKGIFRAIWLGTNTPPPSSSARLGASQPPLMALALACGLSALLVGCGSTYKAAGVATVTAERAMTAYGHFYDAAIIAPADYGTTTAKLHEQRRSVDKAWQNYGAAMNLVDDTRAAGGSVTAALHTARDRSAELVSLVMSLLPDQYKPR
jgi:hypothetical protein